MVSLPAEPNVTRESCCMTIRRSLRLSNTSLACTPPTIPISCFSTAAFCSGDWPLLNRVKASVKIPCRMAVRRSAYMSKLAHSKTIFLVSLETSVSAPPIIPARPITPSPSAMTMSSFVSSYSLPLSKLTFSPSRASRASSLDPRNLS